ncbi:hypothetical protein JCM5353_001419 [Sporobolomyces roseus]
MSSQHPLASDILPYCRKFPNQSSSLFQSYTDLKLAQQWKDVKVIELEQENSVVLKGTPKTGPPSIVLPMNLQTPTSLSSLSSILEAVSSHPECTSLTEKNEGTPTIYLSIVEKDSSIVYYVLRKGIVSPKEVPE